MVASKVAEDQSDDQLGTDNTGADDNFVTTHPLYRAISRLASVTDRHPALRNGAEQVRYASSGPGVFAISRVDRQRRKEYVVVLNNSERSASARIPTYVASGGFRRVYGPGPARLRTH